MAPSNLGGALPATRRRYSAPTLVVLVVVLAALVAPTRGYESYTYERAYEQYFTTLAACESNYAPYMTRVPVGSTENCAEVPCTKVVGEVHYSLRCIGDDELGEPPFFPPEVFEYMAEYVDNSTAEDDLLFWHLTHRPGAGCQPMDPDAAAYLELTVTTAGDAIAFTFKQGCDATCETCIDLFVGDKDHRAFNGTDGRGRNFVYDALPRCAAHAYTLRHADFEPAPVDADSAVSPVRDCWAQDGATVYGGWTVTVEGEPYCCVVRGLHVDNTSLTGCDLAVPNPTDFFFDALDGATYQQCYSSLDADGCLTTPDFGKAEVERQMDWVDVAVNEGAIPRMFAISIDGVPQGAYELDVDWKQLYCTGRGTLEGGVCRMNACGSTTPFYVTVGAATADGVACYHTCFSYRSIFIP